ncbi:MAG: hypothetical protein IJD28_08510, partial [Deferribacterales bacterium]|nr:hypothetical protein [Deferribacterales bacterium]
ETAALGELEEVNPIQGMDFADVEETTEVPFADMEDMAESSETAALGELEEVNPIQGMDFADVEEATEAPFADVEEASETPFADIEDVADLEHQTAPQTVAETTPQTAPLVSAPQSSLPLGSGITITIGREEILSILGRAIDKTILEEAIKEVLAKNMEEIVRAVVPAMAEKYIKAEIERLKNDE